VGLDQWRPQSGLDLLLHKLLETVVFEKFALSEEKLSKIKIINKRGSKSNCGV